MKRTTYFSDGVDQIIGVLSESAESFSGRVGFLVGAADEVAKSECPALPVAVWCALADANNGTIYSYEQGAEFVVSGMTHNLFDYGPNNQFGIDAEDWARRIRKMRFAEQLAVFEVVRRFWTKRDVVNSALDYTDAFRKIGAVVADESSIDAAQDVE